MVSRRISTISLLLGVLDAVSAVMFRLLEPNLLTVSDGRHFEGSEESDSDDGSAEGTEEEHIPRQPRRDLAL